MELWDSTPSVREPFTAVQLFVSLRGAAKAFQDGGSVVRMNPPEHMIATADAQLGLRGQLAAYCVQRTLDAETVPKMDNAQWQELLDRRFPGQRWDRWFGKTPNAIYSVVVVYS
jgi:hypothetical protein